MSDTEFEFSGESVDWEVDIGEDGGVLKVTWSPRRYWINGERVDEETAWVWIHSWHTKRDQALGADRCSCDPCGWARTR